MSVTLLIAIVAFQLVVSAKLPDIQPPIFEFCLCAFDKFFIFCCILHDDIGFLHPDYVHTHIIKKIKDREAHMEWIKTGQRYYVKNNNGVPTGGKVFHSYYRSNYKPHSPKGPYKKRGRPKKKHLMGNAYYKAKREKDAYYVKMGKLGGRPRMYNNV